MPTSSQANILKISDGGRSTRMNYQCVSPTRYPPLDFRDRCPKSSEDRQAQQQPCELVKFDFNVIAHQQSVDGIEGVFAYDTKTNSYRWTINSISPRRTYDIRQRSRNPSGDTSENIPKHDSSDDSENIPKHDSSDENGSDTSDSLMHEQPEITRHFTTPAVSLMDTSNKPTHHIINPRTELHGCAKQLKKIDMPRDTERLDDSTYRQLEDLGFRRRTMYSPGGTLIRAQKEINTLLSPTKSYSDISPLTLLRPTNHPTLDSTAKLTINNLDPMKVPPPCVIPYKRQGFTPNLFVKGESKKTRARTVKHYSLLEEVKQSVNWERRVSPAMNIRRGHVTPDTNAICFSLRKQFDFSHSDVKELIEFKFRTKVKTLQYDPISVRISDPDMYDRWIVTLTSRADCAKVIQQGMTMDGDIVVIRFWDEVLQQETLSDDTMDWYSPCRYKLQQERHNRVLRNFLAVH